MWAVDLRVAANIDAFYLDRANRIRCLSELGSAVLCQRIGLASGRVLAHLDDFIAAGRDVWDEMTLWQEWTGGERRRQNAHIGGVSGRS